jgi:hypothetical protein
MVIQVGRVFSPHKENLMKLVDLWNKESAGLLLTRYSKNRVGVSIPHTRLVWRRWTVLTTVFGQKTIVDVTEEDYRGRGP